MVFNRFRVAIAWRVILLALTIFISILLFDIARFKFTAILLALLSVLEVILLLRYVERTNRKL